MIKKWIDYSKSLVQQPEFKAVAIIAAALALDRVYCKSRHTKKFIGDFVSVTFRELSKDVKKAKKA